MTLKSLQQYGKGFQLKVLGSLLTDKTFLLNVRDVLHDHYFDADAHKWIVSEICKYFDNNSGSCSCYEERTQMVVDCLDVRDLIPKHTEWMPPTCAYRLRANDKPLFDWHPLLSNDSSSVISFGISIQDKSISEENVHPEGYPEHIVRWVE